MRIVGIDPGCESTGYGIIDTDGCEHRAVAYGAVRTSARRPFHERLLKIHTELARLLTREKAELMAIEEVFCADNVASALKLAQARGVILLAAAQQGIPVCEYSALEIKRGVVGYGRAAKEQVQAMVAFLLALNDVPQPSDAADALAVALCHAHRMRVAELIQRA
jgi:crossover junction endodeoxyribonuclease RuvC